MTAQERTFMQDPQWMLVTYHEDDPGKPQVGIAAGGAVYRAPDVLAGRSMLEVLADWDALAPVLRAVTPADGEPVPEARLLAPIRFPPKVLCAGANYYAHLTEMGSAPRRLRMKTPDLRRRRGRDPRIAHTRRIPRTVNTS